MKRIIQPSNRFSVACILLTSVVAVGLLPTAAKADAFDGYQLATTFQLPPGTDVFDVLPDGRIVALVVNEVFLETGISSGLFVSHGTLVGADIPFFGAAFIRVSPDGTKLAVGDNGGSGFDTFQVGVLDINTLSGTWFLANHFDALWLDNVSLMLAAGDFTNGSSVTVLDTTSLDPLAPTNVIVIDHIGGASGGIAIDVQGWLFVGNGFSTLGPSGTGAIKAFDFASWNAPLSGSPPPDFETDGTFVVDVLSASPIGFDAEGNLFTGGGDTAPDTDAIALIRSSAIFEALAGMGAVDPGDPAQLRRLDPIIDNDTSFYMASFNRVTRELYVRDIGFFGDATVYVYRDRTAVPTVSQWGLTIMALLLLTVGTIALQPTHTPLAAQTIA